MESEANISGEGVTVLEFFHFIVIFNVPNMLLLEYTISDTIAELIDKSIEARFGGVSLPTTIKDGHVVISNLSDKIIMKEDRTNDTSITIVEEVDDFSVTRLPIGFRLDCSDHLRFDLTHDEKREGVKC